MGQRCDGQCCGLCLCCDGHAVPKPAWGVGVGEGGGGAQGTLEGSACALAAIATHSGMAWPHTRWMAATHHVTAGAPTSRHVTSRHLTSCGMHVRHTRGDSPAFVLQQPLSLSLITARHMQRRARLHVPFIQHTHCLSICMAAWLRVQVAERALLHMALCGRPQPAAAGAARLPVHAGPFRCAAAAPMPCHDGCRHLDCA